MSHSFQRHFLGELLNLGFELNALGHAEAILNHDFPGALQELHQALAPLTLPITEIIGSGGGETKFTQRLRRHLAASGWAKHIFTVEKTIDGRILESISHEVDHVKQFQNGVVALEIEWNNKDPFFDRDLENFKRLHAEGAISVGVIITRGASLQQALPSYVYEFAERNGVRNFDDLRRIGYEPTPKQRNAVMSRVNRSYNPMSFVDAWTSNFVSNKFGKATTHFDKLLARVQRRVGNPCPLLLIGLPASIVTLDHQPIEMMFEPNSLEEQGEVVSDVGMG